MSPKANKGLQPLALVKPPPSKPKARPAPLHIPGLSEKITPDLIKKVGDLLRAAGFDRAYTILEARTDVYVVHLEGEREHRVITLSGDKTLIN